MRVDLGERTAFYRPSDHDKHTLKEKIVDIKFAYWVPNVSGGLVTSNIPQRTDWSFDYNKRLALTAEAAGFDYALAQARFFASYGADKQLEAVTMAPHSLL